MTSLPSLRPDFSQRLLDAQEPYFHNHVRDVRRNPFPTAEEVGRANAGEGLDLFLAHYAFDPALSNAEFVHARLMLVLAFGDWYAGNRLRSIMVETVGRENTVMAESGGFEVVSEFPAWRRAHGALDRDAPHLLRITLEGAMASQNLHLGRLLHHRPPIFRFPVGARELLRAALRGLTDAQIAEERGLTGKAVDSGWTRIHRIAHEVAPGLFAHAAQGGKSRNRLALLAYLRGHPEELWPHEGA